MVRAAQAADAGGDLARLTPRPRPAAPSHRRAFPQGQYFSHVASWVTPAARPSRAGSLSAGGTSPRKSGAGGALLPAAVPGGGGGTAAGGPGACQLHQLRAHSAGGGPQPPLPPPLPRASLVGIGAGLSSGGGGGGEPSERDSSSTGSAAAGVISQPGSP
jgi:hypothetical protein